MLTRGGPVPMYERLCHNTERWVEIKRWIVPNIVTYIFWTDLNKNLKYIPKIVHNLGVVRRGEELTLQVL